MASNTPKTALVVDDSVTLRRVHVKYLEEVKFQVTQVNNGLFAVNLLKAGATFDVILMDNDMPEMDGIEATKTIKEMGANGKIVAVTVESGHEDLVKAGADEFVSKPLTRAKLVQTLEKLALLN